MQTRLRRAQKKKGQERTRALTSMAQLAGRRPAKLKVNGLIPSQGRGLGCRLRPWSGCVQEATDLCFSLMSVFLSLSFSLLSALSKNK